MSLITPPLLIIGSLKYRIHPLRSFVYLLIVATGYHVVAFQRSLYEIPEKMMHNFGWEILKILFRLKILSLKKWNFTIIPFFFSSFISSDIIGNQKLLHMFLSTTMRCPSYIVGFFWIPYWKNQKKEDGQNRSYHSAEVCNHFSYVFVFTSILHEFIQLDDFG